MTLSLQREFIKQSLLTSKSTLKAKAWKENWMTFRIFDFQLGKPYQEETEKDFDQSSNGRFICRC